jgi:hypothetical protein
MLGTGQVPTTTIGDIAVRAVSISSHTQFKVPSDLRFMAIDKAMERIRRDFLRGVKTELSADAAIILSNLSALVG